MCDKPISGDMTQNPKAKTAYDLIMERRKSDKSIWFTDEICPKCGHPIYTDGKQTWCSETCMLNS